MTNKHIIDVTKCIHFDKSDIPNGCTCYWDGECNHYCYYKQLKRKEQENEKLLQTLIEIKNMCSEIDCESLMENSWCGNTDFKMGCCEKFFKKQILQKIKEVIDES